MARPSTLTELLLTSEKELIKQYLELDIFGRPGYLYEASVFATTGSPCIVNIFLYEADDSVVLRGMKQDYSSWDSSWVPDSAFTVATPAGSKTTQIITNELELTKQYQLLDSEGRPSKIFEAPITAITGTPCLVTEYIYQNGTSTTIKGKKEAYATWDTSWVPDSAFTVDA